MKKSFILLASVFLMIFLGIFIGISLLRSQMQMRLVQDRINFLYAFYAAETGLELSLAELRRDIGWRAGFTNQSLTSSQGNTLGYYDVAVGDVDGDGVDDSYTQGSWIIVPLIGTGRNANRRITRQISAEAITQSPTFFFIFTLGDLRIGKGADIGSSVLARDIGFEPGQGTITVNGDVIYLRNLTGYDPQNPQATPNITIQGDVYKGQPITFVGVDLQRYKTLAQSGGRYIQGDFTITGDISLQNLGTSNGLVYVEGDVYIEGDVKGSTLIVASGNIIITGNIEYKNSGIQIGLFAGNDVIIANQAPDSLTVEGFLLADGGTVKAEGRKGSKDTLDFHGAISVRGREGERTVIDLNAYRHRNYTYDQRLYNNPQIPFMAYIADLRRWQEI